VSVVLQLSKKLSYILLMLPLLITVTQAISSSTLPSMTASEHSFVTIPLCLTPLGSSLVTLKSGVFAHLVPQKFYLRSCILDPVIYSAETIINIIDSQFSNFERLVNDKLTMYWCSAFAIELATHL
jgi:hypothetical protein